MATIMTDSELLRRAVVHLDGLLQERPGAAFTVLLDETAMQFNLGPEAAEQLERLFRQTKAQPT